MDFDLDARLESDSHFIADGPLSQFRLVDDQRFPWLVLVPRLPGATALAVPPVAPNMFIAPGFAEKSSISLFRRKPAPRTTRPQP